MTSVDAGTFEVSDDDEFYDEEDWFDEDEIIIRAKWSIDGATTLQEAANMSRAFAGYLESLAEAGNELIGPVEDDYGFVYPVEKIEEKKAN